MPRIASLVGRVFNRLTVLEFAGKRKTKGYWRCVCSCEHKSIVEVQSAQLLSGHTGSCGCYNKEKISERSSAKLEGKVFGRLTVLRKLGSRRGQVYWECLCSCKGILIERPTSLLNAGAASCGCLRAEAAAARYSDITDKVFGRLTAKRMIGSKDRAKLWECLCTCGNTVVAKGKDLNIGDKTHCGCKSLEHKPVTQNLVGKKVGRLEVLAFAGHSEEQNENLWWVRCECGIEKRLSTGVLNFGNTRSCGCGWKKKAPLRNLANRRFGKLVAQKISREGGGQKFWACLCDCGKTTEVSTHNLMRAKSCGCGRTEALRKRWVTHGRYIGYYRRRRRLPKEVTMFNGAKARASLKGLTFDLQFEDIVVPAVCPLLGVPFTMNAPRTCATSPSLDRIDPKLGYTKSNIWCVSHIANTAKTDATFDEITLVANWLEKELQNQKPTSAAASEDHSTDRQKYVLLHKAKTRSNEAGIPFTLETADISVPLTCPALGIPLKQNDVEGPCPNSPTLDKLIPSDWYTAENTRVISHRANTIKNSLTVQQLKLLASNLEAEILRRTRGLQ